MGNGRKGKGEDCNAEGRRNKGRRYFPIDLRNHQRDNRRKRETTKRGHTYIGQGKRKRKIQETRGKSQWNRGRRVPKIERRRESKRGRKLGSGKPIRGFEEMRFQYDRTQDK
jgi:Ni/Co efflux regulator RcnB